MTAVNQNVSMWRGDDKFLRITVKDENGDAVDLTNARARWWLGKNSAATGEDIYLEKDSDNGSAEIDFDSNGGFQRVLVKLPHGDTKTLPVGKWYHECEVILDGGQVATVMTGKFEVKRDLVPAAT